MLIARSSPRAIQARILSGETRYRAAAEVPIVLLAAIALDALLPSRRHVVPPDAVATQRGAQDEPLEVDRAHVPVHLMTATDLPEPSSGVPGQLSLPP